MKSYPKARDDVLRNLGLPKRRAGSQDWAAEIPEEYRTIEQLSQALAALDAPGRDLRERQILVELALELANDFVGEPGFEPLWSKLESEIRAHPELHEERVTYWRLEDDTYDDTFRLTPYVRAILPTR